MGVLARVATSDDPPRKQTGSYPSFPDDDMGDFRERCGNELAVPTRDIDRARIMRGVPIPDLALAYVGTPNTGILCAQAFVDGQVREDVYPLPGAYLTESLTADSLLLLRSDHSYAVFGRVAEGLGTEPGRAYVVTENASGESSPKAVGEVREDGFMSVFNPPDVDVEPSSIVLTVVSDDGTRNDLDLTDANWVVVGTDDG